MQQAAHIPLFALISQPNCWLGCMAPVGAWIAVKISIFDGCRVTYEYPPAKSTSTDVTRTSDSRAAKGARGAGLVLRGNASTSRVFKSLPSREVFMKSIAGSPRGTIKLKFWTVAFPVA